jgi:cytochrome c biogenesis protein CcmG/thiol:disulfide interchange protein DsbE
MRVLIYALPLIVFAGLAVWLATGLLDGRDPTRIPNVLVDRPVPETDLPPLPDRGPGLTDEALRGEVSLVNIWASWCAPCLAEHPLLTRLAEEEGLPIHGINRDTEPQAALDWLERHGDPFARVGHDPAGRAAIDWGTTGVPETFVVDADGRIRFHYAGALPVGVVERELLPLVAELRE